MMGPGYYQQNEACKKLLDETAGTRKDLHNKGFAYFEANRNPKTDPEAVTKIGKEIGELQNKLYAKAPQGTNKGFAMPCWQF